MTVYAEMSARLIASAIEDELLVLDNPNMTGSLCATRQNLASNDQDRLIAQMRKDLATMLKRANGCPKRIFDWPKHYGTKK